MRKLIFTMVALLGFTVSSQAMSYEQARQQALFLADKMAYELNLTDEQYEACYEVNLDYLMGVNSQVDLYGDYWTRRNLDLSYILADWQYRLFLDAAYFYRPLYWADGFWHFGIYARYPHRDYFYFGRPAFFDVYHGGHAWGMNGGRSWYHGRDFGMHGSRNHSGMRDGFNKGNYGRGGDIHRETKGRGAGNMRQGGQSSTRSFAGSRNVSRGDATTQRANEGSRRGQTFSGKGTSTQRTSATPMNRTESTRDASGFSSGTQRSTSGVQQRSSSTSSNRSSMNSGSFTRSSSGSSAGRSMSSGSRGGSSMSSGSSRGGGSHSGGGSRGGSFGGGRH